MKRKQIGIITKLELDKTSKIRGKVHLNTGLSRYSLIPTKFLCAYLPTYENTNKKKRRDSSHFSIPEKNLRYDINIHREKKRQHLKDRFRNPHTQWVRGTNEKKRNKLVWRLFEVWEPQNARDKAKEKEKKREKEKIFFFHQAKWDPSDENRPTRHNLTTPQQRKISNARKLQYSPTDNQIFVHSKLDTQIPNHL